VCVCVRGVPGVWMRGGGVSGECCINQPSKPSKPTQPYLSGAHAHARGGVGSSSTSVDGHARSARVGGKAAHLVLGVLLLVCPALPTATAALLLLLVSALLLVTLPLLPCLSLGLGLLSALALLLAGLLPLSGGSGLLALLGLGLGGLGLTLALFALLLGLGSGHGGDIYCAL
jgi:hypothetical protein